MHRTTRLYSDQTLKIGEEIRLEKQASHHLLKVLRARVGDMLYLFNGDGRDYASTVTGSSSGVATIKIESVTEIINESKLHTTMLIGISRSDRMDLSIQKSVELGVSEIIPISCERSSRLKSDRKEKKMHHWKQIIISACEQSGRATVPRLYNISSLEEAIKSTAEIHTRLIMTPTGKSSLKEIDATDDTVIAIGPEGGFSEDEVELSIKNGFDEVRLGPRTLRTETASIAVLAAVQSLWGDL